MLTSSSGPVEVGEDSKEDHGGHGDGIPALLQHGLVPFNHLGEGEEGEGGERRRGGREGKRGVWRREIDFKDREKKSTD